MPTLFQKIQAGQLWDFPGGIHPPTRKNLSNRQLNPQDQLPVRLYVPLRQHIGVAGSLLVRIGDVVLKGQPLTAADNSMAVPVHAPTSGKVIDIGLYPSAHPSGLPETTLVLEPDGLEQWRPRHKLDPQQVDRAHLLQRIHQSGIAGMGGAGFPSHIKAGAASAVDYLIINAVECEPYITADDVLMQHHADVIVQGISILCQLLQPKAVLIGIEADKPEAIQAMQLACQDQADFMVRAIPTKYPSGGEKQLIQLLTSKEVPSGRRPIDIGIVVHNVGTAFAVAQAVLDDIPLIGRVVTVTGESVQHPQNIFALIGTPVAELLNQAGFQAKTSQRVIMGGPMMGFTLPSVAVPVVKTTNCLLAPSDVELPSPGPEMDCIRCGACAEVCPAQLLPQQLLWYSKAKDHAQLNAHHLQDCIECGACAYVCPSEIPLVHYYRVAKADIRETQREALKAEQAKARFEARNERLEREKQERLERNQQLAAQRQQHLAEQQKQQILAAQQRHESSSSSLSHEQILAEREQKKAEARAYQAAKAQAEPQAETSRQDAVAAAIARAKAKKEQASDAANASTVVSESDIATSAAAEPVVDPKKAAVAAAIARAKAKKEQASDAANASTVVSEADIAASAAAEPLVDPKKAAVAAAIARAKAKKEQASDAANASTVVSEADIAASAAAEPVVDPKKAAVAAAIARAKAKKEQASEAANASTVVSEADIAASAAAEPVVDPKKAAVAAAIARAKAKKEQASVAANASTVVSEADIAASAAAEPLVDPKKAAVAAAIARAKAKKEQTIDAANTSTVVPEADIAASAAAEPEVDPKKAAIAAAIARAKAKKIASNPEDPS